jgi:hypothetical protein
MNKRDFVVAAAGLAAGAQMRLAEATESTDAGHPSGKPGSLDEKIDKLTAMLQRNQDIHDIQNIVSKMSYFYEAGMCEERMKYIAKKTPGVTVEIGARGVFEGVDGARETLVDVEKSFERSHAVGMRKLFPDVKFGSDHAGMLESELIGTPVIEVAGDGKTARGEWLSLMAVGKTHEDDPKPQALWIWWKSAIDFVKEDGEWKIWHYLKNPYFATPYTKDWVENSLTLKPVPPPGTMKGIPGHGAPDRATTKLYDSYRITREPRLDPKPPEPYQTFDPIDAGEFGKAVEGSQLARGRILDWFHIAMKFKAAENSVFGSAPIEPLEREVVKSAIDHAKWLVWHGKGGNAVARIKALDASLLARQGYEGSTLWWNLRRLYFYIDNNVGTLVNYGTRHRKGLPISSSIAESAVSQRMAKKQQMRWTDEGAHRLAQVRVADLNGELSVQRLAALAKMRGANSSDVRQAA